jgi:hypothetical protein
VELFLIDGIQQASEGSACGSSQGMVMKDKEQMNYATAGRFRRSDDMLGANSDIGMKLRALYSAVQEETIPDKFLELLERLDQAEQKGKSDAIQK